MTAPIYTTIESVKIRLANKVQFQADPNELLQGELPNALLCQLIADAETEVEQDLRGRYLVPFQSKSQGTFSSLPDHTKRAIRTAVDMKAVLVILATDFGRGSHVSAEPYIAAQEKAYDAYITKLLGQDKEGSKRERFRFSPPLDELCLSYSNREADDGFKGMIINTDSGDKSTENYAADQINNPAYGYPTRKPPFGSV